MTKRMSNKKQLKLINLSIFLLIFNLSFSFSKNDRTVLLISLDAFRYDYIDRGFTPTLDKLADDGVKAMYLQPAYPSSTFPNHLSIVTGLYPMNHGIIANDFTEYDTGKKFTISDTTSKFDSYWYSGERFWETCKKNEVVSASYFWPGSELNEAIRQPDYYEVYEHNRDYMTRVNGVLSWLDLPKEKRPQFITLYFDAPDSYAHKFGTESEELNQAIKNLDSVINQLFIGLKQRNLFDEINIIIVSDHGMTNLSKERVIEVDKIIPEEFAEVTSHTAYSLIEPKEGYVEKVKELLRINQKNYHFYDRDSIPERFNYGKNRRISKILMIADCGWALSNNQKWSDKYVASHGYDNQCKDMQGLFIAKGLNFKNNYKSAGLMNIDIYPLLAKLLDIKYSHTIDGDLNRIIHILKNEWNGKKINLFGAFNFYSG